MKNIKRTLSYEEQLNHLIDDKELKVGNKENATLILSHENYYRLSGYMLDFIDANDKFKSDICFEDIYNIYKFDKELRGILFEIINDVEIYFKTQISYNFCLKYGGMGYRNLQNYKSYEESLNVLKKLNDTVKKNPNNLIIAHHNNKYEGEIPLWAMVELMQFGDISKFYSVLKSKDKKEIVKNGYNNIGPLELGSLYHGAVYFRNQCCHFTRLYSFTHTIKPALVNLSLFNDEIVDNSKTFYFIYILMLLNPNKKLGERVIYKLREFMKKNKTCIPGKYGFPEEWHKILHNANGYCIKKTLSGK